MGNIVVHDNLVLDPSNNKSINKYKPSATIESVLLASKLSPVMASGTVSSAVICSFRK